MLRLPLLALPLFLAAAQVSLALPIAPVAAGGTAVTPVVMVGEEHRGTLADFAKSRGLSAALLKRRYAATGLLTCGGADATAQLTLASDVITTAAHAFYDQSGNPRADFSKCTFRIDAAGHRESFPIVASSVRVGSRNPYAAPATQDWAVARLARPVAGARPYSVAGGRAAPQVLLLAQRHRGWSHDGAKAIEGCSVRTMGGGSGPREIHIDCSAGEGASGSAILLPGNKCEMVGIYVGWRSANPGRRAAFSASHYNFGVTVEGEFARAIREAAASATSRR